MGKKKKNKLKPDGKRKKKTYKCTECSARFPTASARATHVHKEHPKDFYECCTCGSKFSTFNKMKRHKAKDHTTSRAPFTCMTCGRIYEKKVNFNKHVKEIHNGNVEETFDPNYATVGNDAQSTSESNMEAQPNAELDKDIEIKIEEEIPVINNSRRVTKKRKGKVAKEVKINEDLMMLEYSDDELGVEFDNVCKLNEWKASQCKKISKLKLEDMDSSISWGLVDEQRWRILLDRINVATKILPWINPVAEIEAMPANRIIKYMAACYVIEEIRKKDSNEKIRCSSIFANCDFVEKDAGETVLQHLCRLHYLDGSPFYCRLCKSGFVTFLEAATHLYGEHYNVTIQCQVCKVNFDSSAGLGSHERRGHILNAENIFVPNADKSVIQYRPYRSREDNLAVNGGLFQLYVAVWRNENGPCEVTVSFTIYPDCIAASRERLKSLRKTARNSGAPVKNCSARALILKGCDYDPQEVITLGIFARSHWMISQLKWWVRLYLDAFYVLAPPESVHFLRDHHQMLKGIVNTFLDRMDQGTRDYVVENGVAF